MPVATIVENLAAGAGLDDVLILYEGLDRKRVQAVIEFAGLRLDRTGSSAEARHDQPVPTSGLPGTLTSTP